MNYLPIDIIVERMRLYDLEDICDLLDIDSDLLISRFMDRLEERIEYLQGEFEIYPGTLEESYQDELDEMEYEGGFQHYKVGTDGNDEEN